MNDFEIATIQPLLKSTRKLDLLESVAVAKYILNNSIDMQAAEYMLAKRKAAKRMTGKFRASMKWNEYFSCGPDNIWRLDE